MITALASLALLGGDVRVGTPAAFELAGPDETLVLDLYAAGEVTLALTSLDFDISGVLTTSAGGSILARERWSVAGDEYFVFALPDTGPFSLHVRSEDDANGAFTVLATQGARPMPDSGTLDVAQIEHWRAAAARALARGAPLRAAELLWWAAARRWARNEPELARDLLYELLDVPEADQAKPFGPLARAYLGLAELRLGSAEVALPMLEAVAAEIDALHLPDRAVELHNALAEVHIAAARFDRARDELSRSASAVAELEPEERRAWETVFVRSAEVALDLAHESVLAGEIEPSASYEASFRAAAIALDRRLATQGGADTPPPAPPDDFVTRLRSALGDQNVLVLFANGTRQLYVFVVTGSRLVRIADVDRLGLESLAASYAQTLASERAATDPAIVYGDGHALYGSLIEPIVEWLGSAPESWVFVPTPALAPVPFDAIVTRGGPDDFQSQEYLLTRTRVAIVPSATLLLGSARTPNVPARPPYVEATPGQHPLDAWSAAARALRRGEQAVITTWWDSPRLREAFGSATDSDAVVALRAAKRAVHAEPATRSPHYWAGMRASAPLR